jgi:hypothetical protein
MSNNKKPEKTLDMLATEIGSRLHDKFRKDLPEDQRNKPRPRDIKKEDLEWIKTLKELPPHITKATTFVNEKGETKTAEFGYVIDINNDFSILSPGWQQENYEGKVMAEILYEIDTETVLRRDSFHDISPVTEIYHNSGSIGHKAHAEWLKRNSYAKGGKLDCTFDELGKKTMEKDGIDGKAEQEKDLNQFKIACEVYTELTGSKIEHKYKAPASRQDIGESGYRSSQPRSIAAHEEKLNSFSHQLKQSLKTLGDKFGMTADQVKKEMQRMLGMGDKLKPTSGEDPRK